MEILKAFFGLVIIGSVVFGVTYAIGKIRQFLSKNKKSCCD